MADRACKFQSLFQPVTASRWAGLSLAMQLRPVVADLRRPETDRGIDGRTDGYA
jgi:hypothetical protein